MEMRQKWNWCARWVKWNEWPENESMNMKWMWCDDMDMNQMKWDDEKMSQMNGMNEVTVNEMTPAEHRCNQQPIALKVIKF